MRRVLPRNPSRCREPARFWGNLLPEPSRHGLTDVRQGIIRCATNGVLDERSANAGQPRKTSAARSCAAPGRTVSRPVANLASTSQSGSTGTVAAPVTARGSRLTARASQPPHGTDWSSARTYKRRSPNPQHRQVRRPAGRWCADEILVSDRHDRQVDADHRGQPGRPRAGRVDHQLGTSVARVGSHSFDRTVAYVHAGDCRVWTEGDSQVAGRSGVGGGQAVWLQVAVGGTPQRRGSAGCRATECARSPRRGTGMPFPVARSEPSWPFARTRRPVRRSARSGCCRPAASPADSRFPFPAGKTG